MCGIVGWTGAPGAQPPDRLERLGAVLGHRGPDDQGSHLQRNVALCHTRLSIIDLDQGAQPLSSEHGQVVLVANGEIYNYVELRRELIAAGAQFQTASDCEVILQGYLIWGEGVLERIEGMYAFALHDLINDRVLLARDPLGMKPLYVSEQPAFTVFASEVKALLPLLPRAADVNPLGLVQFLETQHGLGRTTAFKGIERVLPGEAWLLEKGKRVRRWQHWSVHQVTDTRVADPVETLDGLMDVVFQQHLRSDVPIGLFLSGGVDSTVLLGLMRRYGIEHIKTFSVGFPDSSVGDELDTANRLARHFETDHTIITPTPDDLLSRLVDTVWAADDLMRDWANLPTYFLAESASQDLKVVFSGEGGDEVFAGYGRYRSGSLERRIKALAFPGTGGFRAQGDLRGPLPRKLLSSGLLAARKAWREPLEAAWSSAPPHWSLLQRMQALDLVHALPDNLLVKADRMLMAHGVEGRMPFVDKRIVEFGLGLPDGVKQDSQQGKKVLKDWAGAFMPSEHFGQPKRGFHVPINDWWQGDRLKALGQTLRSNRAMGQWFQPAGIEGLLERQAKHADAGRFLMSLLQFAVWHRLFIEGRGDRPGEPVDPLEFLAAR